MVIDRNEFCYHIGCCLAMVQETAKPPIIFSSVNTSQSDSREISCKTIKLYTVTKNIATCTTTSFRHIMYSGLNQR